MRFTAAVGMFALLFTGILIFAGSRSARADTPDTIYTGSNGTWTVPGGWSNGVPTAGTVAEFNSIYPNTGPTITGAANAAGIWDSTGLGQNMTIGGSNLGLTISGTATINGIANTGILMSDAGGFNLTIASQTITLANSTSFLVDTLGFTGAITRNVGGMLNFTGAGTTNVTQANYNGILGGWALYNGITFAANNAGTVGPLTNYDNTFPSVTVDTGTQNNDVATGPVTLTGNTTIYSLTITDPTSGDSLNLNGNNLIFFYVSANSVGGLLYNPGSIGNIYTITTGAGIVASGSANVLQTTTQGELVVNVTPGNTLKIAGNIENTSTGGGGLTIGGGGIVQIVAAMTSRAPTTVAYGTLQIGNGGATASLSDSSQVTVATTGTLAWDEKIGSVEQMASVVDNGMVICMQPAGFTFTLGNTGNKPASAGIRRRSMGFST
jgi:hypothetical protein